MQIKKAGKPSLWRRCAEKVGGTSSARIEEEE